MLITMEVGKRLSDMKTALTASQSGAVFCASSQWKTRSLLRRATNGLDPSGIKVGPPHQMKNHISLRACSRTVGLSHMHLVPNCGVFLADCPLRLYIMPLFLPVTILFPKVSFIWCVRSHPGSFYYYVHGK